MNPALDRILDESIMIVLGCGKLLFENKRRAVHAAGMAKGRKFKIIVSGNQKVNGKTEAEYMRDVIESCDIERERIFVDSAAYNTATNFAYSRALIEESTKKNIVLVTGLAHMSRAVRMARQMYPEYGIFGASVPISGVRDVCIELACLPWELAASAANSIKMGEHRERHGSLNGFYGAKMPYNSRGYGWGKVYK